VETYIWHGLPSLHQATFYKLVRLERTKYDISYRICGDYYIAAKLFAEGIHATYLNSSLVNFPVGGIAYYNPLKKTIEPFLIQKRILNLPFFIRYISMLKRLFSTFGFFVFSQNWIGHFYFKKSKKVSQPY